MVERGCPTCRARKRKGYVLTLRKLPRKDSVNSQQRRRYTSEIVEESAIYLLITMLFYNGRHPGVENLAVAFAFT